MVTMFKFIVVNTGAVLFNQQTTHSLVAEGFKKEGMKVFSAGFCTVKGDGIVTAFGESDSLKIKSHPEIDKIFIEDLFSTMPKMQYFAGMYDPNEMYKNEE
jgi:hypothetical protein